MLLVVVFPLVLFAMKLKELIVPPLKPVVVVVFGAVLLLLLLLVPPNKSANGSELVFVDVFPVAFPALEEEDDTVVVGSNALEACG